MTRALVFSLLVAMPAAAARIGNVSGRLLEIDGRHEFGGGVGVSVNDAFFRKVYVGGRYGYHLTDWAALELSGDYALAFPAGAIERCPPGGGACTIADEKALAATPGNMGWQAAVAGQLIPLYGKLSLFSESIVHFDLYLTLGAGAVGYQAQDKNGANQSLTAPSGIAGLGAHLYLSRSITLRLDTRHTFYEAKVRGESDWQSQPQITLSLSILAP